MMMEIRRCCVPSAAGNGPIRRKRGVESAILRVVWKFASAALIVLEERS
jgi:hypothetical protein